jgi:hypothetical protein
MSKKNKQRHEVPAAPARPQTADVDNFNDFEDDETPEAETSDTTDEAEDNWDEDAEQVHDPSEDQPREVFTDQHGKVTPMLCRNCALWATPQTFLDNKVMCRPGKTTSVQIGDQLVDRPMAEDLWSCRAYFIPRGLDLNQAVPTSVGQAAVTLQASKWLRCGVALQQQVDKFATKYQQDRDDVDAVLPALSAIILTDDAYRYTLPLVQSLADTMVQQHKASRKQKRPGKVRYRVGDEVAWVDPGTGTTLQGFILTKVMPRTTQIDVLLSAASAATVQQGRKAPLQVRYDFAQWRQYNPTVTQAANVVVVGPEGDA